MRGIGIDNIVAANIIMVIVLAFLSYEDYRYRSISAVRLVIIMVLAVLYRCFNPEMDIYNICVGISVLAGMFIYCRITGNIGAADIVVIAFLGIMRGTMFAIASMIAAFIMLLLAASLRMLVKHINGKREVPFIPYLGVGVLGVMLCV